MTNSAEFFNQRRAGPHRSGLCRICGERQVDCTMIYMIRSGKSDNGPSRSLSQRVCFECAMRGWQAAAELMNR